MTGHPIKGKGSRFHGREREPWGRFTVNDLEVIQGKIRYWARSARSPASPKRKPSVR